MLRWAPALVCALVWGSTFCVAGRVLVHLSAVHLAGLRFLMAYVILWVICRERQPIRFSRAEGLFLLLGVSGGSGYFLLEFSALRCASSADVGIIVSSVPLLTSALLHVMGRERMRWRRVASLLTGMAGVALVTLGGDAETGGTLMGHLLAIGAAISWAVYSATLSVLGDTFSPLLVTRRLFFWAMATLLPFVLLDGKPDFSVLDASSWAGIVYLGVVASALCVWLWGVSTVSIGASATNAFLLLMPVVALVIDFQSITWVNAIGAGIVICTNYEVLSTSLE